jgi:hypothetical protein
VIIDFYGEIFSCYELDRTLGDPQVRSRRVGVEIIDVAAWNGTLDIQIAPGLQPTELPRLPKEMKFCGIYIPFLLIQYYGPFSLVLAYLTTGAHSALSQALFHHILTSIFLKSSSKSIIHPP